MFSFFNLLYNLSNIIILSLNVRLSDSNFFGLFCCLIQDFEPYVMITSALMLVKRSETAIAVQLCRFLCRFTQLFIYQRKKNTYQYIKVVMISGQMYSPRDLYFTGNIRLLVIRFMVISGQLFGQKNGEFPYIQVFSGPVA